MITFKNLKRWLREWITKPHEEQPCSHILLYWRMQIIYYNIIYSTIATIHYHDHTLFLFHMIILLSAIYVYIISHVSTQLKIAYVNYIYNYIYILVFMTMRHVPNKYIDNHYHAWWVLFSFVHIVINYIYKKVKLLLHQLLLPNY